MSSIKKILLLGPYGIGNTILALPAIKILRKKFPDTQIDIATLLKPVYDMIITIPDFQLFNNIYLLDTNMPKLSLIEKFFYIRKQKYDFSILLFPSARIYYNILSFLSGAKNRVSSKYPDINFQRAYFLNNINIPVIKGLHDVYQNINLLEPFGIDYKKIKIKTNKSIIALKKKKNIIGIHPGCKKEAYFKRWDNQNYLIVIKEILKKTEYKIKLFFGPAEIEEYNFFVNSLNNQRVKFVFNKSIQEVFKEINECRIFISNDTGLMHIANFLGSFNIVIIGPSDFKRTGPFNRPYKLFYADLPCRPCSHTYDVKSHKFHCNYNIKCMKLITPEMVTKYLFKKIGGNWRDGGIIC